MLHRQDRDQLMPYGINRCNDITSRDSVLLYNRGKNDCDQLRRFYTQVLAIGGESFMGRKRRKLASKKNGHCRRAFAQTRKRMLR